MQELIPMSITTQQINACCASPSPAFGKDARDELKDDEFEVPLKEKVKTPLDDGDKPLLMMVTNPSKKVTTSGLQGCSPKQSRFKRPL